VRARFAEDIVEQAVGNGVCQYVILGAGLDSFAYRREDLLAHLRVFEVDHPATQSWKRRQLSDLGVGIPGGLVFAPVDFERQTLRDGLESAGFDFGQRAVFAWLGVAMFLTLDAISATLSTIMECAAGTRLVLTYNQPRAALQGVAAEVSVTFVGIATEMGEPFITRFLPREIGQLLREHGFDDTADFGPEEALTAYFQGRTSVDIGGSERLIAATVRSSSHGEVRAPQSV
jgi:methyltransferase (TIGR00027 family)